MKFDRRIISLQNSRTSFVPLSSTRNTGKSVSHGQDRITRTRAESEACQRIGPLFFPSVLVRPSLSTKAEDPFAAGEPRHNSILEGGFACACEITIGISLHGRRSHRRRRRRRCDVVTTATSNESRCPADVPGP